MRIRDRIGIAIRGLLAEIRHDMATSLEQLREEHQEFTAEIREARHWDLVIRRKITGKQDPTRRDVRRVMRQYRKERRS